MATLTGFDIYVDRQLAFRKATFTEGDGTLVVHSQTNPSTNVLTAIEGGTFTDVILVSGNAKTSMVFTATNPEGQKVAIVAKARGGCGCGK